MEVKRFMRLRTASVMHLEEFRALQGVDGTWSKTSLGVYHVLLVYGKLQDVATPKPLIKLHIPGQGLSSY
jgi:hypothetical protein